MLISQSPTSTPISLVGSVYSGNFEETFNEIFPFFGQSDWQAINDRNDSFDLS